MKKYLLENVLFPIVEGNDLKGQGFLADGYLITAAHVVKQTKDAYTVINEKKVYLKELPLVFIGDGDIDKNSKEKDIAVYECRMPSPLHLSVKSPQKVSDLKSYVIEWTEDINQLNPILSLSVIPATYQGEEGNYFYCDCARHPGSSGSPLLSGNEVVGIMHGGKQGLSAFLKIESFLFP